MTPSKEMGKTLTIIKEAGWKYDLNIVILRYLQDFGIVELEIEIPSPSTPLTTCS
jgi:hypothetical protein